MDECGAVDNAVHEAQHAATHSHGGWKAYIRYLDGALEWWLRYHERSKTDTHR